MQEKNRNCQESYELQQMKEILFKDQFEMNFFQIEQLILIMVEKELMYRTHIFKNNNDLQEIYMIYIQTLIVLQQYVKAQQIIGELKQSQQTTSSQNIYSKGFNLKIDLNPLYVIFTDLLQDKITAKMKLCIVQKSQDTVKNYEVISFAMKQLTIINQNSSNILQAFIKVINAKIDFFTYVQSELFSQKQFNLITKNTLKEIQELLDKLTQNYEQFPTIQNQSVLMIFQVEVLNDVLNAYTFSNTIALDEDIILKHQQSELFNIFNQSFNFMIFNIFNAQNIVLKYHSTNQVNEFDIKEGIQLANLIPNSFQQIHQNLVEQFLEYGKNKYFYQINETYMKLIPGVVQPIDICMDLNFSTLETFELVTVYRKSNVQKYLLFVDQQFRLIESSVSMLTTDYQVNQKSFSNLIGINIQKIIPFFKKYVEEGILDIKKCNLNLQLSNEENQIKTFNSFEDIGSSYFLTCHLQIDIRQYPNNAKIYIAQLDNIKIIDRLNSSSYYRQTIVSELQDVDEEICIDDPDLNYEEKNDPQQIIINTERGNQNTYLIPQPLEQNLLNEKKITDTSIIKFNQLIPDIEIMSNISSIAQIRKSIYFRKFEVIAELINSKKKSQNLLKLQFIYLVYIVIVFSYSIKLLTLTSNLSDFISEITLISIKNEVYRPIEAFLLTRYTIVAYNQLLAAKQISSSDYALYVAFPKSNIVPGYDDLKVSITKVLEISEFQPFLEGNYQVVYLYQKTGVGQAYNLTFRTDIQLMLNYQYEYVLAYTVKPLQTDSAYSYYSYKDYITIFNKFVELRDFTLQQTFISADNIKNEIQTLLYVFSILAFLLILHQSYLLREIRIQKNKILTLIKNQNVIHNDQEILKLKTFLVSLEENKDQIHKFQINIEKMDEIIKIRDNSLKHKQFQIKSIITIRNVFKQLCIYGNYLLFFAMSISFYELITIYLSNYKQTAQFYSQLSDAEVQVLLVYGWKEALYFRKTGFSFLTSTDIQAIIDQINQSLDDLQEFTSTLISSETMNSIFDDDPIFQSLIHSSICDNLSDDFKEKISSYCPQISQGVLSQGILPSINYIISTVKNEYESTGFSSRTVYPNLELEAATLVSDVLQNLVDELQKQFQLKTSMYQEYIYIFISIYLCMKVFSVLIMFIFAHQEQKQLDLFRKFVYLIPSGTLFYDEHFLRVLKGTVISEQLV